MPDIEELLNRKPSKWSNLSIKEFERDIKHLQNEVKFTRESEDYLIKIREELSDIEFKPGTLDYAVAKPEGIYLMAMELKQLHLDLVSALREIDNNIRGTSDPIPYIVEVLKSVLPEYSEPDINFKNHRPEFFFRTSNTNKLNLYIDSNGGDKDE